MPTSAPNIGIAIGPFEIHVDRAMPEMTHFAIPGVIDQLILTTQTTHQVIEYLEDLLSARFPYALYKQVFVEKLPEKTSSYASMTLFNRQGLNLSLKSCKSDFRRFCLFLNSIFFRTYT